MNLKQNHSYQANALFKTRYTNECNRVNRFMMWLMLTQWVAGVAFATFYSPLTWIGQSYEIHIHIWAAILLGGAISGFAILWTRIYPNETHTRHVIAFTQMLWSALLIHLSGGRIETHFHVFASLAILSIYRDWKILITATVVVAVDHFVRGVFYPLSAFGIITESPYRWIEHAAWVIFEVSFLMPACMRLRNEIWELCERQTEIEAAKNSIEAKVQERTAELVKANQQLAEKTEEAEKLALVARYTDNAVVITDSHSRIEWVNEGYTRITGYTLDEVIGRKPSEFQHGPKTDPETLKLMRTAVKNKTGFDAEVINYRKDGEPFWLAIEARPIRDESGEVSRFIAIESDISSRKSMEMSLSSTEQRLRSLVDNVPGVFFRSRIEDDRRMLFISKSVYDVTGYRPEEFVVDRTVSHVDLVHPDDVEKTTEAINLAASIREPYEIEYRIVDRRNQVKWVWERGHCLLDNEGDLILDGMVFDITDRKLSEAEVASKGKLIEESLNEIFIFDAETLQFMYVNRAGRENIGYSLEELKHLSPVDIKPEHDAESFNRVIEPLRSGQEQQLVFRTTHLRKDETTYDVELHLQCSRYQDQDVFLAMILDVTDRIQAEQKNDELQKELITASRMAGMTEVANGVLHNVGNILNSVNVSVAMIRKRFEKSALSKLKQAVGLIAEHESTFADFVRDDQRGQQLPNYMQKVTDALACERSEIDEEFWDLLKNVEHIKEIISVQQTMAKSSGLNQELIPQEVINDVLAATKGSLTNHHILVEQTIECDDSTFISDKHKILQILINLINNAKDALVEHQIEQPSIHIESATENNCLVFRVKDNGIGIPEDKLEKIFQHGFTTKKSGHGFGLHSSANAATELGGSLTVSSAGKGHGASFQLTVPNSSFKSNSTTLQTATV